MNEIDAKAAAALLGKTPKTYRTGFPLVVPGTGVELRQKIKHLGPCVRAVCGQPPHPGVRFRLVVWPQ